MSSRQAPIRLGAFVPYPVGTTPSQRYRIEQWAPHLAASGVDTEFLPFATRALHELLYQPGRAAAKALGMTRRVIRRVAEVARSRRFDAVFLHRGLCLVGPALLERLFRPLGVPLVYDFDDAIYLPHASQANRDFGWLKFPGKTAAICRASDHVVVGNGHLERWVKPHNPRTTVIPTSIDTDSYRPSRRPTGGRVVIGWTGSSTSQQYLEDFAPVLRRLLEERDVEVLVISNRLPEIAGVPATWQPWSAASEVADLERIDVGIMPIRDDEWSRGKCAAKALQYMAMGIATVASDVGANREVIQDGANGRLAASEDAWLEALVALVDDAGERRRLGAAARETVETRYSMRVSADKLRAVVEAEVARARSGR